MLNVYPIEYSRHVPFELNSKLAKLTNKTNERSKESTGHGLTGKNTRGCDFVLLVSPQVFLQQRYLSNSNDRQS